MDLYILNPQKEIIKVLDSSSSVIWTRRYFECGDFEIYMKADSEILKYLTEDNLIMRFDSPMTGIIENTEVNTDPENGDYITVIGRDLKSLLMRRTVWKQTTLTGTVRAGLTQLLNENVINPTDSTRKIPTLVLGDLSVGTMEMSGQYIGQTLYDVIVEICKTYGLGWDITLDDNFNYVFKLYAGVDRSYDQDVNDWVVFSPDFNNLLNTTYRRDLTNMKNVANVAGEGEGLLRRLLAVGDTSGVLRREFFVDAKDITSDTGIEVTESFGVSSAYGYHDFTNYIYSIKEVTVDGEKTSNYTHNNPYYDNRRVYFHDCKSTWYRDSSGNKVEEYEDYAVTMTYNIGLSPDEYNALLRQRGLEELSKLMETTSFDGDVDSTRQYVLDQDFFVGDIVQVVNEYGLEASPRILEIIECEDENGISVIPTFGTWNTTEV